MWMPFFIYLYFWETKRAGGIKFSETGAVVRITMCRKIVRMQFKWNFWQIAQKKLTICRNVVLMTLTSFFNNVQWPHYWRDGRAKVCERSEHQATPGCEASVVRTFVIFLCDLSKIRTIVIWHIIIRTIAYDPSKLLS